MSKVLVMGAFDSIQTNDVRFLEEAAKLGELHVDLWPDETIVAMSGASPMFPAAERLYFVRALRYVHDAQVVDPGIDHLGPPTMAAGHADIWAVMEKEDSERRRTCAREIGLSYHVVSNKSLKQIPSAIKTDLNGQSGRKKVLVTGCFDWLHSGHVRFFEETASFGDLYVVLGHDENVRLLKGQGHPLFPAEERRYMVQAIRHVFEALVSSGSGWMDAAPEIERIKPDIYAVNEDGDKPEKREFCAARGIEYLVLRRLPKEGLPARESTALRGF